jgi:hypothetical protein
VRNTPRDLYVLHTFTFWFPYADQVYHHSYIIDVEFQIFYCACPVGFEITLQRYTGEMITPLSNNDARTIDTLIWEYEDVAPVGFRLHFLHRLFCSLHDVDRRIRCGFSCIYPDGTATGSTFSTLRDKILPAGFDPSRIQCISYVRNATLSISCTDNIER